MHDPGCCPGLGNERPFQGGRVAHLLGICYIPAYDGVGMPRRGTPLYSPGQHLGGWHVIGEMRPEGAKGLVEGNTKTYRSCILPPPNPLMLLFRLTLRHMR